MPPLSRPGFRKRPTPVETAIRAWNKMDAEWRQKVRRLLGAELESLVSNGGDRRSAERRNAIQSDMSDCSRPSIQAVSISCGTAK